MNRLFFFAFCLFFVIGCSGGQQEAGNEGQEGGAQEAQEQAGQAVDIAGQEQPQESTQEIAVMRNPFLTEEEESARKETGSLIPINYLSLSAIIYSAQTKKAIIEGRILCEGDSIDNKRIVRIEPEAVILKDDQGEYIIRLRGVAGE